MFLFRILCGGFKIHTISQSVGITSHGSRPGQSSRDLGQADRQVYLIYVQVVKGPRYASCQVEPEATKWREILCRYHSEVVAIFLRDIQRASAELKHNLWLPQANLERAIVISHDKARTESAKYYQEKQVNKYVEVESGESIALLFIKFPEKNLCWRDDRCVEKQHAA